MIVAMLAPDAINLTLLPHPKGMTTDTGDLVGFKTGLLS
jgi:hypothetical protein